MKKILTLILAFTVSASLAQRTGLTFKSDSLSTFEKLNHSTASTAKAYIGNGWIFKEPVNFTYLSVMGHVVMSVKNSWLFVAHDTSKVCIKYQDSIFVIHISPKYVHKINDSTYTFPNK